ncbi:hypothetical protein [Flavobacterium capsici]|uniref:Uncharacterized protein n=1 Tax=Flavobacterium capsici TaxID=3075618 RepID=A0AA96J652_9FLAO|nr:MULTISPECIES: hypothetical protein [unclassified Flavobacterium]WNM18342.1 hypothetical protein RN608_09980 [Flavobacterium sp. PMR2A8]WNM22393.1 hypothetical protein RN605_03280 [Flavobacterium sp. PMTSA4]
MKERLYKNCALSLLITTLWTLYGFFKFYFDAEEDGLFYGWGILVYFLYTIFISLGLGVLLLIIRLILHFKKKSTSTITNFFYILAGIANMYMFLIWIICTYFNMIHNELYFSLIHLGSFLISGFIFYDVIRNVYRVQRT